MKTGAGEAEVDIHIWKKPETHSMVETFTISVGKQALCHYMPKEQAMECLSRYLDSL